MAFSFVRSLVKHTLKHGGNALAVGLCGVPVPIGTIASAVFEDWCEPTGTKSKHVPPPAEQARLRAELASIVQDVRSYRAQVDQLLGEMGAAQPEAVRQAARTYLNQLPGRVQSSLRRPEDPSGRTVPDGLILRHAEDLQQLLPERMPRFQAGARPVPGTDLVIQELLGVGGFGEVWKAVHQSRPHLPPVALKFCTDETAARTLRKEVELLDRVSREGRHHGIVELRYAHLESDPPCLEYEYVDGGDLAALVTDLHRAKQGAPLTMTRLCYALAQAVGIAHRIQPPVVHRDLKPANVLTTRLKNRVVLKVADFGIGGLAAERAQREGETIRYNTLTQSTGSCTPLYASPQQRRGGGPDLRDDVYALGVIWYQMLLGDVTKEPPTGASWKKRLHDRGATPAMVDLLERCLEVDPADRPADAQVLAEELVAVIKEATPAAAPPPLPPAAARAPLPAAEPPPLPPAAPPPLPPAEQWFFTKEGKQEGPIPFAELVARAQAGKIQNTDMVWTARLAAWVQAGSIPGLGPVQPPSALAYGPVAPRLASLEPGERHLYTFTVGPMFWLKGRFLPPQIPAWYRDGSLFSWHLTDRRILVEPYEKGNTKEFVKTSPLALGYLYPESDLGSMSFLQLLQVGKQRMQKMQGEWLAIPYTDIAKVERRRQGVAKLVQVVLKNPDMQPLVVLPQANASPCVWNYSNEFMAVMEQLLKS